MEAAPSTQREADAVPLIQFPKPFEHAHPPVRNVNELVLDHLTAQDEALRRIVEALAARGSAAAAGRQANSLPRS
jgi:hypothetical protein